MMLPIVKYGDPVLRVKGKRIGKVDDEIRRLASDMIETMHAANGVGLAAQQVGRALQITVIDVSPAEDRPSTLKLNGEEVDPAAPMPLVLLNPEIKIGDEKVLGVEGCLSFPEITADIERAHAVSATAQTLDGETISIEATGLLARALQHEVDHLNGVLFIDRMNSAAKASWSSKLKRLQKETRASTRAAPRF
jgi:peptide deformylase